MLDHRGTKKIETKRLILRRFKIEDVEDMYNNWASDSEVTKYLTWPSHKSINVSKSVIEMWIEDYTNIESYQWAIELKESGSVVGSISLMGINNGNENCEVGYCIGKEFWNKGIMTEAFSAIIEFGFNEIGFQRIGACHHVNNTASGCVMKKCNLKYEGILRKIGRDSSGNLVDCKYYSILKDEYFK